MTRTHDRHRARTPMGRTQARRVPLRPLRRDRPAQRGLRGFSLVELAVSFGIFLILASVLTLAIGRSYSTATIVKQRSAVVGAITDELAKIATVPYAQVVTNQFTVPDPCPGSGTGIAGTSCVHVGAQQLQIAYGYQNGAGDTSCATKDPAALSAGNSAAPGIAPDFLNVNGCVTAAGSGAFLTAVSSGTFPTQTRQINAPRPGFGDGTGGSVRVTLAGNFALLGSKQVWLIHPADNSLVAATHYGSITTGGIELISGIAANACTSTTPCALALSPGSLTPTETTTGSGTVALMSSTAAGAGARFSVPAGQVTDVSATVSPVSTATLSLSAVKNNTSVLNPVPGSVCLWVTFPDSTVQRTVPVCNRASAGQITLDTYDPNWASYANLSGAQLASALASSSNARYPFPAGVTLRLSVDNPDGTCPYAPGMLASRPGTPASSVAPANWAPLAVCTSYTWGEPSRLDVVTNGTTTSAGFGTSGVKLTLPATGTLTGTVVWNNQMLAPGVIGYGTDPSWGKPRTALGCSADQSCTSTLNTLATAVADPALGYPSPTYPSTSCLDDTTCREAVVRISPEWAECPQAYCYSQVNALPTLTSPATSTQQLSSSGNTTSFTISVADSDDPASTITAAASTVPSNTSFVLGTPTGTDAHTMRYPVTFTDNTGNTNIKVVTLTLSSGSGSRAQSTTTDLGLYYQGGAWQLSGSPVTAAQGATNVPVRVKVTGTDGNPYAGAVVQFSVSNAGVTIPNATSDSSGYATGVMSVSGNVPAGSYTINASISGSGRSQPIGLTVTAATSGLSLSLANASVAEGGKSTITVKATDGSGAPVSGVVTTLVVVDSNNVPSGSVYPASTGCVTDATGTCSVPLVVDPSAPAGTYSVTGSSDTLTATPQAVTVTPVLRQVTTAAPITVAQGQTLPGVTLTLLDGAGKAMPSAAATISSGGDLTASPATGSTDSSGVFTTAVSASSSAPAGSSHITVTSNGASVNVPATIGQSYGSITAPATSVNQGDSGSFTVTVAYGNGTPVAGVDVNYEIDQPGISYDPVVTTDNNGQATSQISVDPTTPAGTYPVLVTVGSQSAALSVTVAPVAATVSASGAVTQGGTSPLTLTVQDLAGNPMPGAAITFTDQPATMTLTPSPVTTGSDGTATVSVTDTGSSAGDYSVTANIGSLQAPFDITVLATPGQIQVDGTPLDLPAGAVITTNVTVLDRAGDPDPGVSVSTGGFPTGVSASTSGPTDDSGTTTLSLTMAPTVLGGSYSGLLTAGGLSTAVPVRVIGDYSNAELNLGPSLLLALDDSGTTADDLADAHAGTYVGGISTSFAKRQSSTLPGSDAVSFAPTVNGTVSASAKAEVHVADPAGDLLDPAASFSVSTWVNPRSLSGSRAAIGIGKGQPTAGKPGFSIGAGNSSTSLRLTLSDGTHTVDQQLPLDAGYQPINWVGSWTNVIVIFNRDTGTAVIWVDGVQQSHTVNIAAVTGAVESTDDLVLGSGGGYYFDGLMDDTALFPRVLTPAEITGAGGLWAARTG